MESTNKKIDKTATIENIINWANRSVGHGINITKFKKAMEKSDWEKNLKEMTEFCKVEIVYLKEQSDSWDEISEFTKKNPKVRIPGFPFSLIWPTMYSGQTYEIITVAGEIYTAKVDDSREFMSEGLEWKTIGKNKDVNKTQAVVAAWKEQ